MAFNSTSAELSFIVSGPEGTTGFVKATIAKSLISNGSDVTVYLDGNQLNYTLTSTEESWVLLFNYSHSTHEVAVYMGTNLPAQSPSPSPTVFPSSTTISSPSASSSPQPEQSGFLSTSLPTEYGYGIISAVVLAVVLAAVAFAIKKRK